METLHSHTDMIDLNPLVVERHPIKPPPNATADEYHYLWYSLTDRVSYLPGGLMSGKVSYNVCFQNLEMGLQTHCYAPMGLDIRGKWTLGGSLPGEPLAPVELGLGAPLQGLYLREDVDLKCNIIMKSFVKKTLKNAHASLVDRLLIKAAIADASLSNQRIADTASITQDHFTRPQAPSQSSSTIDYGSDSVIGEGTSGSSNSNHFSTPPSYSMGSNGPEDPDTRDMRIDTYKSLHPTPLSVRSSSASHDIHDSKSK